MISGEHNVERWSSCWKCGGPINWAYSQKCFRCFWAMCRKCGACRRPMAVRSDGRRGPCPREVPLFADTLSLRWARDCFNQPINWTALGVAGPKLITPNEDPEVAWLKRLRVELRMPQLHITSKGLAAGYGILVEVPENTHLMQDPRAVTLVGLALEHQSERGVSVKAGTDRLSASIGNAVYGLIGGTTYESPELLDWELIDDLEARHGYWGELLIESD